MSSVVCNRRLVQWSFRGLVILALGGLIGCQPGKTEKKPSGKDASVEAPAKEAATPAAPAKDLPGVETPVKDMPHSEPAKKAPEPKTSTPAAPAAPKTADKTPAGSQPDATLDVSVKWLPKPIDNPDAEAQTEAQMKPYTEKIINTDVKFDMVKVPGGTYKMGSPANAKDAKDDEKPQIEVKIEPFWMGKYEVRWEEYEQWGLGIDQQRRKAKNVAGNQWDKSADALAIPTKPYADMTFGMGKEGFPAVCMTQFAAKMYCKWLSAKTGRYYRLPTETEWEYACRAGSTTAYSFGDDPAKLGDYGWFEGNSDEKYQKVGKKKPNAWGLYDMHGNVCEWCVDEYAADRYKQLSKQPAPIANPFTTATKMYPQVVRGGAWTDEAALLRSAARRQSTKDWKAQDPQIPQSIWYFTDANFVGFRLVRPLRTPTPEEAAKFEVTEFEKQEFLDYKKAQAGKQ